MSFSGDDLELAHRLLLQPEAVLARGTPEVHTETYDVVIVGGGIAGLTVAYKLRDRRVLLLERDKEPGGVSKSETWQGIMYATGAAYIIDSGSGFGGSPGSGGLRAARRAGPAEAGRGPHAGPEPAAPAQWRRQPLCLQPSPRRPRAEIYPLRGRRFFEHVLDSDNYPSVPPTDPALVEALDRVSFKAFLKDAALQRKVYGRLVGPIPRLAGRPSSTTAGARSGRPRRRPPPITGSTSLPRSSARCWSSPGAMASSRAGSPSASRAPTRGRCGPARGPCASSARGGRGT